MSDTRRPDLGRAEGRRPAGRGRGSARALSGRRDRRLGWGHRGLSPLPRGGGARLRHGVRHHPAPVAASREPARRGPAPGRKDRGGRDHRRYAGRAEPRLRDARERGDHDPGRRVAGRLAGRRGGAPRADRPVPVVARRGSGRERRLHHRLRRRSRRHAWVARDQGARRAHHGAERRDGHPRQHAAQRRQDRPGRLSAGGRGDAAPARGLLRPCG